MLQKLFVGLRRLQHLFDLRDVVVAVRDGPAQLLNLLHQLLDQGTVHGALLFQTPKVRSMLALEALDVCSSLTLEALTILLGFLHSQLEPLDALNNAVHLRVHLKHVVSAVNCDARFRKVIRVAANYKNVYARQRELTWNRREAQAARPRQAPYARECALLGFQEGKEAALGLGVFGLLHGQHGADDCLELGVSVSEDALQLDELELHHESASIRRRLDDHHACAVGSTSLPACRHEGACGEKVRANSVQERSGSIGRNDPPQVGLQLFEAQGAWTLCSGITASAAHVLLPCGGACLKQVVVSMDLLQRSPGSLQHRLILQHPSTQHRMPCCIQHVLRELF